VGWQQEEKRPRPPRDQRADVDYQTLKDAEENWPSGNDRIMVALEALAWLNSYGIRLKRALTERLDEEMLAKHGSLEVYVYKPARHTSELTPVKPHAYAKPSAGNFCDVCWQPPDHLLHRAATAKPPPAVELLTRIGSDANQLLDQLAALKTPKET
jgi:hypothetical protein